MSTGRQRRPSQFTWLPAEQDHVGDPVEADLQDRGHGPQPVYSLRDMPIFNGHPFRDLDPGQEGGLLEGEAGLPAGGLDAETEQAGPGLAQFGKAGGWKGREHRLQICVLIYSYL